ncbi:MAG: nhaS3 [Gemmatimonadetes bacterium]|nr:nhaS3 [Gemmatimonadota bacterium]
MIVAGWPGVLVALVAMLVLAKLFGRLAQRVGQPAVLGELVAGVLLGASVLGVVDPAQPAVHALAQAGVVLLLFGIGLETDLRALWSVGSAATAVAVTGMVLPFASGYAAARLLGIAVAPALVCGAALCATSVGISSRVLADLGLLQAPEGRVVLGAAVLDDVIGLVILAVVVKLVGTGDASGASSAMIIGAFVAGLLLHRVRARHAIERVSGSVGFVLVPIFFASVGAEVDLRALADPRAFTVGAVLIACGVAGKLAAGYAPWWFTGNKLLVGVAMVPRGEVGLIFAQMGLASGAIDAGLFGALMMMVLVTTFVTPPLLARCARAR